jgi:hypothetical protein
LRTGSPVQSLHESLADALHRLGVDHFDLDRQGNVQLWQQMWGSTACGHPGMGGASMTECDIVSVEYRGRLLVYSAGRLLHDVGPDAGAEAREAMAFAVRDRAVPAGRRA